jgi:hypothetical protein
MVTVKRPAQVSVLFEIPRCGNKTINRITERMLSDTPAFRQNIALSVAYEFVMDFLESVGNEMNSLVNRNQELLKSVFDAFKTDEEKFDKFLSENMQNVSSP